MSGGDRDPGLQPERTRLAWRRTTLSCTVVALLAGRQAVRTGPSATVLVAVSVSMLAWLGFLGVAHSRVTRMRTARPRTLAPRGALTTVACTVVLAVCAAAMVL